MSKTKVDGTLRVGHFERFILADNNRGQNAIAVTPARQRLRIVRLVDLYPAVDDRIDQVPCTVRSGQPALLVPKNLHVILPEQR